MAVRYRLRPAAGLFSSALHGLVPGVPTDRSDDPLPAVRSCRWLRFLGFAYRVLCAARSNGSTFA